jgi:hypothetical protein
MQTVCKKIWLKKKTIKMSERKQSWYVNDTKPVFDASKRCKKKLLTCSDATSRRFSHFLAKCIIFLTCLTRFWHKYNAIMTLFRSTLLMTRQVHNNFSILTTPLLKLGFWLSKLLTTGNNFTAIAVENWG